jgi:energy-coupling factor transport system substrate-specific component
MEEFDQSVARKSLVLALIPVGIALNVALGAIVNALKLPIYLDAVGTILITILLGWQAGITVGVASFVLASVLVSPVYIYFVGTQVAIAVYIHLVVTHLRVLTRTWKVVLSGIGLGIVAGIVSAPVIVYVFGGASGSGRDLVTALIVGSGQQIMKAVLLSGAASEPIDKTLQFLLAYTLLRALPNRLREEFPKKRLADVPRNNLMNR